MRMLAGIFAVLKEIGGAITTRLQLVRTKLKIEVFRAQCIKAVQSIKVGIILVQLKLGLIGSQLLTIAHKIYQRVLALLQRGR